MTCSSCSWEGSRNPGIACSRPARCLAVVMSNMIPRRREGTMRSTQKVGLSIQSEAGWPSIDSTSAPTYLKAKVARSPSQTMNDLPGNALRARACTASMESRPASNTDSNIVGRTLTAAPVGIRSIGVMPALARHGIVP
jgi:hypothetical protein